MNKRALTVGLGEILWDFLPSGRVLGGAPANFAYMSSVLGDEGVVASRIGNDELGCETLQAMHKLQFETSYIQHDEKYRTGSASVMLDANGQPKFEIKVPSAWDHLQWTQEWKELSAKTDVVCFGSLAQRSSISAATIERFLQNVPKNALRICDVNLRDPFYNVSTLRRLLEYANIVKVNNEELLRIAFMLKIKGTTEQSLARKLLKAFELDLVCVTRGAHGSLLITEDDVAEHDGYKVTVVDAVGAGDAFTACLVHYYIRGAHLEEISRRANQFGSWVATQTGAMPTIQNGQLQKIFSCIV